MCLVATSCNWLHNCSCYTKNAATATGSWVTTSCWCPKPCNCNWKLGRYQLELGWVPVFFRFCNRTSDHYQESQHTEQKRTRRPPSQPPGNPDSKNQPKRRPFDTTPCSPRAPNPNQGKPLALSKNVTHPPTRYLATNMSPLASTRHQSSPNEKSPHTPNWKPRPSFLEW